MNNCRWGLPHTPKSISLDHSNIPQLRQSRNITCALRKFHCDECHNFTHALREFHFTLLKRRFGDVMSIAHIVIQSISVGIP